MDRAWRTEDSPLREGKAAGCGHATTKRISTWWRVGHVVRPLVPVTFEVFDWRAPTLIVRAPTEGVEYELGASVEVDYECIDEPGGSGIEFCDGDLHDGQPLDTSRVGSFTLISSATGRLTHENGRYKFLVKAKESWEGSCRQPAVTLDYGTTHIATVRFKR
jgi:hypothetical protein